MLGCVSVALLSCCAHAEDCSKLTGMSAADWIVTRAEVVSSSDAATVPYCRVQGKSAPTKDSDIQFELWIPIGSAWNGKFEQVGNGGFAGGIPAPSMASVLSAGYAVAATDDGHQSKDMTDAGWALDHEEKVKDYGWRAIGETTLASKQILRKFESRAPVKSYFVGCSDGGREAMMMAQRYPTFFDGIVAGAPAFAMSRLLTSGALRFAQLNSADEHLPSTKLALLQASVLKSCGKDAPYLSDPRGCRPDPASLKCRGADSDSCLTDRQIEIVQSLYRDQKDPATGGILYGVLPGAEAVKGGWDAWLTGTDDGAKPLALRFAWNYLAYMVMKDPHFDTSRVTVADIARGERHYAPIMDANDPNLSVFRAHGGKLIQYHGWNDPGIPPGYSLEYRHRLTSTLGNVDDFYRLYMVPGMLHCAGGAAPTNVNWQSAIEAWVENGKAPGALTARDANGNTQTLAPFADSPAPGAR
jgi:feruloyl esterase